MEESARTGRSPLDLALLQRLDACRPGSDDVERLLTDADRRAVAGDSRYAEWQRRSAAFDTAVVRAYADATIPEAQLPAGLAERLQAALAAAAIAESSSVGESPAPPQPARLHRRRWLAAAGSALTTTAAGWALLTWWRGRERDSVTEEELLHEVLAVHQQTAELAHRAVAVSRSPAPTEFPLSSHVVPEAEPRWQRLAAPLAGRAGVAYELAAPAAPRAVLYVLAVHGERGAPELPPLATDASQPPSSTGGCSLGVWREGDRIVVLVVDGGDERRYRSFVERPQAVA